MSLRSGLLVYGKAAVSPMRVRIWARDAMGQSPHKCEDYNADFNGEEIQICCIRDPVSIRECCLWSLPTSRALCACRVRLHTRERAAREGGPQGALFAANGRMYPGVQLEPVKLLAPDEEDDGKHRECPVCFEVRLGNCCRLVTQQAACPASSSRPCLC